MLTMNADGFSMNYSILRHDSYNTQCHTLLGICWPNFGRD